MSSSNNSWCLKRLFWRLAFLGVFLLISWVSTFDNESSNSNKDSLSSNCNGSLVEYWFESSERIMENFDYSYGSATIAYSFQMNLSPPDCLDKLHGYTLEFYYNVRESERANNNGDFFLAKSYADKALEAASKLEIVFDRLEEKYGWE